MPDELDGLTDAEVRARFERGEVNNVAARTSRTTWEIVRANVLTRFNALLGSLFVVILSVGPWQDALFGGVLVVNALIGIIQELRAKRTLDRLALLSQSKARGVRSERIVEIPAAEIVLDDILELAPGDQILVDGVALSAHGLDIDESMLTGEAEPVSKSAGDAVLSGSFVIAGNGRYRATRVGPDTYAHRLASEAREFSLAHSELRAGINRILRYVTWAIVPTAVLLFTSQLMAQAPVGTALLFSSGGVIAMVPEGLILLTSMALAMGALRLGRRHVLVQDLPAVETLARVDVICLDKTGTLTERTPQIERVEMLAEAPPDTMSALAALAAADPNPNAALRAIAFAYPDAPSHRVSNFIPFSSARKWSGASLDTFGTWVLGAPEVLLAEVATDESVRIRADGYARTGRRVLLLAHTDSDLTSDRLPRDLAPAALVLLTEQIRADAAETLRYFAEQGIAVKIMSGDHPDTVSQVAMEVGAPGAAEPVDAREFAENPAALSALAERHSVFGRLSPYQKQSLVAALQAQGYVVAMVGDGINDVLALKQADIGIAMGAGVGAARAVSQLVLLDNRFASLPSVMAEGRRVIGNVERLAGLFLTKTVYAMLLAFAVGLADVTFPFLPRHLSLIGALTIGIPAFFLSLEASAERARPGFVGRVLRFAVPAGLIAAIATFATYALVHAYLGGGLGEARSAAVVVLASVALWILFILTKPLSPSRSILVGAMVTTFAVVLGVPWLRTFFALELLPLKAWFAIAGIALVAGAALHWSAKAAAQGDDLTGRRPFRAREVWAWLLSPESPKRFLMFAALLLLGGAWLFFGVLEDIVSKDPLVVVDVIVHDLLRGLRTPLMDSLMVGFTELGDANVLVPVTLVVLAWFVLRRLWQTALYWLAAIGVAELLVKVLKFALHRRRPGLFYGGIEQFSFPSSHATMSVVVYGFLAFLLCREEGASQRKAIMFVTGSLIALIALSRLYLGTHWLSDVLGGLSFGAAWVAALAVAYVYQSRETIKPRRLAVLAAVTLLIAGSAHIATRHASDVLRYSPTKGSE